jgi:hypothetical protein
MRYYRIPATAELPMKLETTEANCKAELKNRGLKADPKDLIHEIPVDKDGLKAYVEGLYIEIHTLQIGGSAPAEAPREPQERVPDQPLITLSQDLPSVRPSETPVEAPQPIPAGLRAPTEEGLQVAILDAQIEALGESGVDGLEKMSSYQELTGVGANFARGVILLCVLAAGEHQMARLFHREKRKKFG